MHSGYRRGDVILVDLKPVRGSEKGKVRPCINLSTARSVSRAREVGIRKVIGANKSQLVRQFIGESLFFSIGAFFFVIAIVQTIKPVLENISGTSMSANYLNNCIFVAGIVCFLVGAGVLANIISLPVAWYVMNRWLQNFAYRIHTGMDTFLPASGIALLLFLLTVSFKVFKAASANPVDSIRYE